MNRTLLTQNAQLAMQKDGFVRQIFALEVKVQDLETALRSLGRGLSGSGAYEMDGGARGGGGGGLGFLFRSTTSSLSQSTKSAVKTITGGRKAGSGGSSRQIVGGGEQEMQQT